MIGKSMVRWRVPAAVVCVAAGTALLFWTTSCSKPLTEAQESGKALYELNCYECHEENQLGLKRVPPKLHSIFSHHYLPDGSTPATDAEVRQAILYGKRTMPAFNGRLSEAQIADLIAYLHRK